MGRALQGLDAAFQAGRLDETSGVASWRQLG
jgi:hypothetical protein